jgi:hypothetical protein
VSVRVSAEEFQRYLRYARNLEFTQTPDYEMLRQLFRDLMRREGWAEDNKWDWSSHRVRLLCVVHDELLLLIARVCADCVHRQKVRRQL